MDNLTNENFFGEMQQKFPEVMNAFWTWLDEYKNKNNWIELFNAKKQFAIYSERAEEWYPGGLTKEPEFQQLPLEFQKALLEAFYNDQFSGNSDAAFVKTIFEDKFKIIRKNFIIEGKIKITN